MAFRGRLSLSAGGLLVSLIIAACILSYSSGTDVAETGSAERGGEYCETEVFRAACADNEVVLLVRARYGRMRLGRCVEFDLGYIDCYTDVLTRLDKRCSGRRTCQVRIPDAEFEATGPCLKELKTYLEVSYLCVPVETASTERCANSYINVTLPTGYISSRPPVDPSLPAAALQTSFDARPSPASPSPSRSSSPSSSPEVAIAFSDDHVHVQHDPSPAECDHSAKPWVVAAARGQRINLTLYDFALDEAHVTNVQRTHESGRICRQYGWIDDSAFDRPKPLCAGDRRITHLETSRGHVVKIWTMSPVRSTNGEALETTRFMIKYTVIGCPDPESVPDQTWFERSPDGHSATMGCVNAEVKWSVYCVSNAWVGYHANCTTTHEQQRDNSGHVDEAAIPYGLAIGVGAIIGVFIALVIVLVIGCRRHDVSHGVRTATNTATLPSDKRLHQQQQQQQQLQLHQLEDYTYYAAPNVGKHMSTAIYDCPCDGGGGGGNLGTTTIEGRNAINEMYTDRRRPTGRGREPLSLPTCDLCAIQTHPAAMFEYGGTGSSVYYDRTPWQTTTYSRLPVVGHSGNAETTYGLSQQHRLARQEATTTATTLPEVDSSHVAEMSTTSDNGRPTTTIALGIAGLTPDVHTSGRTKPQHAAVDLESVLT